MNEKQTLFILRSMLNEAEEELNNYRKYKNKTYLMQSSEKVWNATTQLVNLNQMRLDLPVSYQHYRTIQYMKNLKLSDTEYSDLKRISQQLHKNFYTGRFVEYEVAGRSGISTRKDFIAPGFGPQLV